MGYIKEAFGKAKNGKEAYLYTFTNSSGMRIGVSDFGAVLVSVIVKDKMGQERDVVLGYDSVTGYEADVPNFGSVVGRNANRIGGAVFELNGETYSLCKNDGENNLHSGLDFYKYRFWNVEEIKENAITFSLFSPHMDQGYPGNVTIYVTYTLTDANEVQIEYRATPDADTLINMTNHSYFNLDGHKAGSIYNHKVWIDADAYTRIDAGLIPTGELIPVKGTPMDFRTPKKVGQDIEKDYEALALGLGYDHNFVLNDEGYRKVAGCESDASGIRMEIYTDLPGIQLYTGNFLAGETGKDGATYPKRCAACFETQLFPDAIHHENFASPICKKGETYYSKTAYKFMV